MITSPYYPVRYLNKHATLDTPNLVLIQAPQTRGPPRKGALFFEELGIMSSPAQQPSESKQALVNQKPYA